MEELQTLERRVLEGLGDQSLTGIAVEKGIALSDKALKHIGEKRPHLRDSATVVATMMELGLVSPEGVELPDEASRDIRTKDPLPTLTSHYGLQHKIPPEAFEKFGLVKTEKGVVVNAESLKKSKGFAAGMLKSFDGYLHPVDREILKRLLKGNIEKAWVTHRYGRTVHVALERNAKEIKDAGLPPIFGTKYEDPSVRTANNRTEFTFPFVDTVLRLLARSADFFTSSELRRISTSKERASQAVASVDDVFLFRDWACNSEGGLDERVRKEFTWHFEHQLDLKRGGNPFKPVEPALEKLEGIVRDLKGVSPREVARIDYDSYKEAKQGFWDDPKKIVAFPFWWRFFTDESQKQVLIDYAGTLPRDVEDGKSILSAVDAKETYKRTLDMFPDLPLFTAAWRAKDFAEANPDDALVQAVKAEQDYELLPFEKKGERMIAALENRLLARLPSRLSEISIPQISGISKPQAEDDANLSTLLLNASGVDRRTFRRLLIPFAVGYAQKIVSDSSEEDLLLFAKNNSYTYNPKFFEKGSRFGIRSLERAFWHGIVRELAACARRKISDYANVTGIPITEELGIKENYSRVLRAELRN